MMMRKRNLVSFSRIRFHFNLCYVVLIGCTEGQIDGQTVKRDHFGGFEEDGEDDSEEVCLFFYSFKSSPA